MERMFRAEDLQAYMMRLFLEYAVSIRLSIESLWNQRLAADEGVDMVSPIPIGSELMQQDFHYEDLLATQRNQESDVGLTGEGTA